MRLIMMANLSERLANAGARRVAADNENKMNLVINSSECHYNGRLSSVQKKCKKVNIIIVFKEKCFF